MQDQNCMGGKSKISRTPLIVDLLQLLFIIIFIQCIRQCPSHTSNRPHQQSHVKSWDQSKFWGGPDSVPPRGCLCDAVFSCDCEMITANLVVYTKPTLLIFSLGRIVFQCEKSSCFLVPRFAVVLLMAQLFHCMLCWCRFSVTLCDVAWCHVFYTMCISDLLHFVHL